MDLTDATITEIAQAISFDRSYVSKWYNGKLIPVEESWEVVIVSLSEFFAGKMDKEGVKHFKNHKDSIEFSLAESSLSQVIKSFLEDGYYISSRTQKKAQDDIKLNYMGMIASGANDFIDLLFRQISSQVGNENSQYSIYHDEDIIDALDNDMVDRLVSPYTSDEYYLYKFMTDIERLDPSKIEDIYFIHKYFRLVSQMPFMEFQLYDNHSQRSEIGRFVIEDYLCGYTTDISASNDFNIFLLRDDERIKESYRFLSEKFDKSYQAFKPCKKIEQVVDQMKNSPSQDRPCLYISIISAYMGNLDLREEMRQEGLLEDRDYKIWEVLNQLISSPRMNNADIIITEEALDLAF